MVTGLHFIHRTVSDFVAFGFGLVRFGFAYNGPREATSDMVSWHLGGQQRFLTISL
jgi:hypothetical protein